MLRSVDIKSTNTAGGRRDLSSFYRSPRDPGLFSPQVSCPDPANPGPCVYCKWIAGGRQLKRHWLRREWEPGEVMMASKEISLLQGRVIVVGDVLSDVAIAAFARVHRM